MAKEIKLNLPGEYLKVLHFLFNPPFRKGLLSPSFVWGPVDETPAPMKLTVQEAILLRLKCRYTE